MQPSTPRQRMSRRTFLRTSASLAGLVMFSACVAPGAPGNTASSGAAPAQEPITIRYGRHDPGNGANATIKSFMEANPNIKVSMEQIGEFHEKIPALAAAGTLPDVVRSWEAMVLEMGRNNQFIDEQSYIDATADFHPEDFYENWWKYPLVDGKRVGVPDAVAPHVTFYNVDLFEKKGVEQPKADQFTWDDFEQKARQLSDPDNKIWGSETIPVGWHYFSLKQVWQNGGDFYSEDYKTCIIDKTEAIEAIDYWAKLLLDGHVMPSPSQIAGIGGEGAAAELMSAGKIGMQRMGSWITNDLVKAKIKFNVVPEPSKKRRDTITHGAFNAIATSSKYKDEAWKWVNANCSTQGIYNYCADAKFPGCRKSTNQMKPYPWVADVDYEVNWDVVPQSLDYGHVLPGPANEGEALKVIGDALQKIYAGDGKAADLFPQIADQVTKVLQS